MDLFDYYGFFDKTETFTVLDKVENTIIDHLLKKYLPTEGRLLDSGAGNGANAFKFADAGYVVTAIDSSEENVSNIQKDSRASSLNGIFVSGSSDLSKFEDGSFDIIISLGPMYNLQTKADREVFVREALRVLSPDGYFAFSFMSNVAITFGQYFKAFSTTEASERLKAYRKLAAVEKTHSFEKFYGMNQDELADISRECGIDILTIASTYSMLNDAPEIIGAMSPEEYDKFIEDQISTCEDPFITRYCMRGLFVGRKKQFDPFA